MMQLKNQHKRMNVLPERTDVYDWSFGFIFSDRLPTSNSDERKRKNKMYDERKKAKREAKKKLN